MDRFAETWNAHRKRAADDCAGLTMFVRYWLIVEVKFVALGFFAVLRADTSKRTAIGLRMNLSSNSYCTSVFRERSSAITESNAFLLDILSYCNREGPRLQMFECPGSFVHNCLESL